jgi:hypothetical protein
MRGNVAHGGFTPLASWQLALQPCGMLECG